MESTTWKGAHDLRTAFAASARAFGRNVDFIALLLMMAAVCNFGLSLSDQPIPRDSLNPVDESWEADLVFKASQGQWSGRDFVFTYGPLWQFLASLLPRAAGLSAGSVFKLLYLFSHWFSFLLSFLVARVLLSRSEGWRRAVFLIALVVFWLPIDVRIVFAVFCFAVFVRLVDPLPPHGGVLIRSAAVSFLVIASFLLAMDAGFLSAAALAITLFCNLILKWRTPERAQTLRLVAGAGGCLAVWMVLVNAWASSPFDFRFWLWNAQMTSTYRWLMAQGMTPEIARRMALTAGGCAIIFAGAWFTRDEKSETVIGRPLFLMAAALFGSVALQKGLVRSGWGQVSHGLFPAVVFSGLILIGYRKRGRPYVSTIGVLMAVALTVAFSGPNLLFRFGGAVDRVLWTAPSHPYCPPGTYYLDQVCFQQPEYATFGRPARYVSAHSSPADAIVVYPFQNLFGLLSRRRVSAGVLQNYAIGGDYLTALQISTIERERPAVGVYCVDNLVSWPVDGISNFQRTAPVWLYLQSHYVAEAEPAPGVMVLRRDEKRAQQVHQTIHPLWRGDASAGSVAVDQSRWMKGTDFLRVKIRTDYSPLWKLAKASAVTITLELADGSSKAARVAVEPDRLADVWIYPWDEVNLRSYFHADAGHWKEPGVPMPAVRSLTVRTVPHDPLSVRPRLVEVESLEGIELRLKSP